MKLVLRFLLMKIYLANYMQEKRADCIQEKQAERVSFHTKSMDADVVVTMECYLCEYKTQGEKRGG